MSEVAHTYHESTGIVTDSCLSLSGLLQTVAVSQMLCIVCVDL